MLSAYLGLLTVYPDQPYGQKPIVHPITGDELIVPKDTSSFDELHEKDYSVLEIVRQKVSKGGRVLVYTSWIRTDTQEKLCRLLTDSGYRAEILTSSVPPAKREEWVENRVMNGIQVLITNPGLVETGLDLNDFTTLYYYSISYSLFTLRQSSRRSWRINQKAPRIEVYFSYYAGTMQNRAVRLMASKLAAAGMIEGNFTDEGLAAMSDCTDMTTALARELTQGIKNEVEDLSAVFKKMAVLKPAEEDIRENTSSGMTGMETADASGDSSLIVRDAGCITDISGNADYIEENTSGIIRNTAVTDIDVREDTDRDMAASDEAGIIRNAAPESCADDIQQDGDAADTVKGIAVCHVDPSSRVPVMDDTKEMTVYSAEAPVTVYSLLSFVNCTRPAGAVNIGHMDMNGIYFCETFEEPAA